MSRTTQSTALRTLALVSAVFATSLAAPAAGHAQAVTPGERALLGLWRRAETRRPVT